MSINQSDQTQTRNAPPARSTTTADSTLNRLPAPGGPRIALRDVILVFVVVTITALVLNQLQRFPPLKEYSHLLTSLLFLATALVAAQRDPRGIQHYGLDLAGLLLPPAEPPKGLWGSVKDLATAFAQAAPTGARESAVAAAVAAVVLPLFTAGFYLWHAPTRAFAFGLPTDLLWEFLSQLIVVGLPEEALFRGYFHTRLNDCSTRFVRLFGVGVYPLALTVQSILFALIHFAIDFQPARLAVFFPALLFGWLRAWRGGIGAAIAFHALCNIYSDILVRGWLQ
jgi:membrane protease YdiL (CAAX protease family)